MRGSMDSDELTGAVKMAKFWIRCSGYPDDVSRFRLRRELLTISRALVKVSKRHDALLKDMERIASPDELVGLGPLEPILADPTGAGERELKARMDIAAAAVLRVDGDA